MKIFFMFLLTATLIFGMEENEDNKYLIRVLYGKASYSSLRDLVSFQESTRDEQRGTLIGIQFENYLARDIWNGSGDLTYFSSFIYHRQDIKVEDGKYTEPKELSGKDTYQLNGGIKVYWKTFPWSRYVRTRIGLGEGISLVRERLDIEIQNTNNEDEKSDAHILNYLDLHISFNLRDITRWEQLENYYIGGGLSHRSGIFGYVSGVDGGSNYWTFFIEGEF
ncbi:hypothetical protein PM10SUCC1_34730 [Propionigenium maris DSM 9537]|uniref:Uncharacterized protein n=1 Tax=Propionigenium maris DSM 9537 TaxID=1123000 RepID=A0A9W6GPV9_9FUSO|nr:hypothetical protein [Propionigenium maris]GLI57959.1 hypothetical protein PM10SUCC1_34730 [Propionigenium maris DSM 9537]